jgi:saccharopepsin
MKTTAALAALLGTAAAGVHKMKLEKVSLDQQLQAASITDQVKALRHKYTQKFMGGPSEDIFKHTAIDLEKGPHNVPVENFLNAQCKHANSFIGAPLIPVRLLDHRYRHARARI